MPPRSRARRSTHARTWPWCDWSLVIDRSRLQILEHCDRLVADPDASGFLVCHALHEWLLLRFGDGDDMPLTVPEAVCLAAVMLDREAALCGFLHWLLSREKADAYATRAALETIGAPLTLSLLERGFTLMKWNQPSLPAARADARTGHGSSRTRDVRPWKDLEDEFGSVDMRAELVGRVAAYARRHASELPGADVRALWEAREAEQRRAKFGDAAQGT